MTRRVIAMAGKDNGWLLVGLLSLAVWALAGDFALAQAPDWETYMEAATKAYREGRYAEAEKQLKAALKEAEAFTPEDPRVATSRITWRGCITPRASTRKPNRC